MYESLMAVKHNSTQYYHTWGKLGHLLISLISIMCHIKLHYEIKTGSTDR